MFSVTLIPATPSQARVLSPPPPTWCRRPAPLHHGRPHYWGLQRSAVLVVVPHAFKNTSLKKMEIDRRPRTLLPTSTSATHILNCCCHKFLTLFFSLQLKGGNMGLVLSCAWEWFDEDAFEDNDMVTDLTPPHAARSTLAARPPARAPHVHALCTCTSVEWVSCL